MLVVRKPTNTIIEDAHFWRSTLMLALFLLLYSCNQTSLMSPKNTRDNIAGNGDGSLDNKAYVYLESPFILGATNLNPGSVNIADFVNGDPQYITSNSQLSSNCTMNFFFYGSYNATIDDCIKSFGKETEATPPIRNADRTWIFETGSSKFYQTSTLYHLNKAQQAFHSRLEFAYKLVQAQPTYIPKSIPSYLKDSKMFWFKGVGSIDSQQFQKSFLSSYSDCNFESNASFSPAGPELCFGSIAAKPKFKIVQDPSVIYHEFGHAIAAVMMNLRNGTSTSTHPFRSNLGRVGYSEATSIGEGFADYFSYVVTKRTHFGEWALGKTLSQSRPMSERDPAHINGIDTTSAGRLSYPQYVLYDPNFPTSPVEDEHYAGQIISHYLVALTESLRSTCSYDHNRATSYVMLLIAESFSEIGDLNARGVDEVLGPYPDPSSGELYFNNLDKTNSFLWSQFINPITFRRFSQTMAKNIRKYISNSACMAFDKNKSERLLDDYGLLLFKTYNDNGNSTKDRTKVYQTAVPGIDPQVLTNVTESNRRKTVLVSKSLLDISSRVESSTSNPIGFYIIDNRTDMQNLLANLLFKGFPVPISTNVANVDFNNGNIRISPGEIVGIIPNIYNSSNSTVAGVHVLAQDWDHVHITDRSTGNFKPCAFDSDVTVDQGGFSGGDCDTTETEFRRNVKDTSTGLFPTAAAAPICLVQLEENDSTRWVSQNEYRKKQGLALPDKDCLGYSTGGSALSDFSYNPHECLVRFLPGANDAFFSKIDSRKTFFESVIQVQDAATRKFNVGNLLIMEVNKWIPPGTKFKCRMRVNFSNCSDCFADSTNSNDDFLDSELMGPKPYKILNFDFDVND